MNRLERTIKEIHHIDDDAPARERTRQIHPVAKLLVTVVYMVFVVSYHKYDLAGVLSMAVYPLCMMIVLEISFTRYCRRLRMVFLFVCLMGAANLLFDRQTQLAAGTLVLSGGAVSMMTLWIKALLSVSAVYILMETARIEDICYALRCLKVPGILVTILLLTYRYLVLMLKEADRIMTAYAMRAPGQRGVRVSAWGSLAGGMLLRTLDRGQRVYDSMLLRGFHGEFYGDNEAKSAFRSIRFGVLWCMILLICRCFPVFEWFGRLFA